MSSGIVGLHNFSLSKYFDTCPHKSPDGAFSVPHEMLPKLNKSTTGWREISHERGGGVAGLLEGFHQIHCLVCGDPSNLIRNGG